MRGVFIEPWLIDCEFLCGGACRKASHEPLLTNGISNILPMSDDPIRDLRPWRALFLQVVNKSRENPFGPIRLFEVYDTGAAVPRANANTDSGNG